MKRFAFVIIPLMLSALAPAQDLKKKVTLDEPAAPMSRVLADLSKVSGLQFTADQTMSKETLVISVKDIALSDLMKRIATVSSGMWSKQADTYDLETNAELRTSQDQAYADENVSAVRAELDKLRQSLEPKDPATKTDADSTSGSDDDSGGPIEDTFQNARLADKLLLQVDPAAVAALGPHDRLVLASNPTQTQYQLPAVDPNDLAGLITLNNELAKAQQQAGEEQAIPSLPQGLSPLLQHRNKPISGNPAKILLIISDSGGKISQKTADLRFYDSRGNVTYTDRDAGFQLVDMTEARFGTTPQPDSDSPEASTGPVDKGVPIEFSEVEHQFLNLRVMGPSSPSAKVSPELKKVLFDPSTYEPLSIGPSTAILAIAQSRGEQLVGDLPDSLIAGLDSNLRVGMTTSQYLAVLKQGDDVLVSEQDGILEIVPKHPSHAREQRFDRDALTTLLQDTAKRGAPSLDALAAYSLVAREPNMDSPEAVYFFLGVPGGMMQIMIGGEDWQSLRFYGSLRPDQKDVLRNGQVLNAQVLGPDQVELVRQMVYGNQAHLKVGKADAQPKQETSFLARIMSQGIDSYMPAAEQSYLEEPTESMPQGLPEGLLIGASVEPATMVKIADDNSLMASMMGDMGPDEYSFIQFAIAGGMGPNSGEVPRIDKLVAGSRLTYHIKFQLLPNVYMERDLIDDSFPDDASPVSPADLPSDFKEKTQKLLEELKKQGALFGARGGG